MPLRSFNVRRLVVVFGTLSVLPTLTTARSETEDLTSANFKEVSTTPQQYHQNSNKPVPLRPSLQDAGEVPEYESVLIRDGSSHTSKRQNDMRVLVVGDSITHSREGDYTWRYRLLEWFSAQGVVFQYVGPYAGTIAPDQPGPPKKPLLYKETAPVIQANTDGGYALGTNSTGRLNHFAISGRSAVVDKDLIEQVAKDHPADLMLIDLGFNDLGFFTDDVGLLGNMLSLINNTRRASPNMTFVVATVVHRSFLQGREDLVKWTDSYNRIMKARVSEWSTASSPVTWAPVREEYDCGPKYSETCPAAFDGLHPNELGEYQIARGFSRALVSALGIGDKPLEVPDNIPPRQPPAPSNIQVSSSDQGVTATWDKVYGAYEYDVEYTVNGTTSDNSSPKTVQSNRWDTRWAMDGWIYRIRIRSSAGNRKGDWTDWSTSTARPRTAAAPSNVVARSTDSGIDVSWTGSTGPYSNTITQYDIYWFDQDVPCSFVQSAGFLSVGNASLVDLVPGHKYSISVEAWNNVGAGLPGVARSVIPGRGTPATVSGLKVEAINSTTAHLTWDTVPDAAGYYVSARNINIPNQTSGTWNYEYAVTAFNGEADAERSQAVMGPPKDSPPGAGVCLEKSPKCPPPSNSSPPATDPIDPSDPPRVGSSIRR
ncbi:uncharacterized protein RCC_12037 [Ramularia collo-cygni]|uniref:Fibronectin type-III domain-containing protein n=1 Tax=Ramularia collo-cygni TaxID=112498 RepID=A0A2D3UTB8_9PEZI|nr:uncharacterized protein RCC_12037 [Ramularia collo-cygni]CZT15047.1 uncharacterized protein RCC_12037 [Ramularia collo-cygni]